MKTKQLLTNVKDKTVQTAHKVVSTVKQAIDSPRVERIKTELKWENLGPKLVKIRNMLVIFTKEQPKTACFIYVCLFCAFSIKFLDLPFAEMRLETKPADFWTALAALNPSGWWFLILIALWLIYMAVAGLSLTTEAFEKNLAKARTVAFVLLALALSSLITIFFNILVGRYTPEFLETTHTYGFSAFRFRLTETSFPSFGAQSIWAVAVAAGFYFPRLKKLLAAVAALITISLPLVAQCFISDAVMGAYIGILMFSTARWIVSENRDNTPLFTR